MTGLLKDLMNNKAADAGPPHLDLDAIVATGDKRVRRRRVVTGAGIAAVAAAVILAVAVVPGVVDSSGPDPVAPPPGPDFSVNQPTYAIGSTIHYGDQTIDVAPQTIGAFARTDSGFVFATAGGDVYFTDGQANKPIGSAVEVAGRTLVADDTYVAWVDPSTATPEVVVYSTAERAEVLRTSEASSADGQDDQFTQTAVTVMDGSTLYWHNSSGVVVSDVTADAPAIALLPGASSQWLYDAVDGVLARASFDDITVTVSRETGAKEPNFTGTFGNLSPDTSYVATRNNAELHVFEVQSGRDVTPERLSVAYSTLLEWLDGDSYLVVTEAEGGNPKADVLECSTLKPACKVVEADVANLDVVVGPDGPSAPVD